MQPEGVFPVRDLCDDPRIHIFRSVFHAEGEFDDLEVDAYVVLTERYAVVLDTLLRPEDAAFMMQSLRDQLAGKQVLVVNSHADWDHAWGNAYFTAEHAAPILAHELGRARLQSEAARVELADFQHRYPSFANVTLVPPTLTFTTDLTIHGGDLTIELLPTPGHQPDHIAAWLPQLRLLLVFDTVEKPLPCLESAAAVPALFSSLARLLALEPHRVLCSHGKTTSPSQIQSNLDYLREVESRCRALLSSSHPTPDELETASTLIHYTLDDVLSGDTSAVDRTFYSWAHDKNVRCMLLWLIEHSSPAKGASHV